MNNRNLYFSIFIGFILIYGNPSPAEDSPRDQLLRLAYDSAVTGEKREYFVYLPANYAKRTDAAWPVILFLHGNGERGNGLDELDYVLTHGPLMETWIQRRDLPFVIISPQLPLFGELEAIAERLTEKPARSEHGATRRNYGFPSDLPIQRTNSEDFPEGVHSLYDPFSEPQTLPAGWDRVDEELISMLDTVLTSTVLTSFRTDPNRVYLTGLSMGGFGTFHMAAKYPDRWAAIAPVVGTGKPEDAKKLADAKLPIWMFGGGKDTVVKPHWLYRMARALEEAGHPSLRFTVHEDMNHDAWKRVYEGEDLYNWFMRFTVAERPQQEKSTR